MTMTTQGTAITTHFTFERETKGAVRLAETDEKGRAFEGADDCLIGTVYMRKARLPEGRIPKGAKVTIELEY